MIDRTQFAAQGTAGGQAGALGELHDHAGQRLQPKTVIRFDPGARVHFNPPGGGGYGNPFERDPERVRDDVANEYVSIAAAERDYGVVLRYLGGADRLVRLPDHYVIDWPATEQIRREVGSADESGELS